MSLPPKRNLLVRPWTPADVENLKRLHAASATLLRAAAALNRRGPYVRKRAQELGLHFAGVRETKRQIRLLDEAEARNGTASSYR